MKWEDFRKWFNRDFWRAFRTKSIPIPIPATEPDREELLRQVFDSIQKAEYFPGTPQIEILMNKGHGVVRTVPVLRIEDYCVYYFCIKELEDVLCVDRPPNTFGGWALGGKFRSQEAIEIEAEATIYGRYSFDPKAWIQVFGEFNSLLFAQMDQGAHPYVLQFDLANFYDCVRLDILERWIREESPASAGWIITLLFFLLNQWNRKNTGLHPQVVGLPQDALADCSRILANFYLQRYDAFAARAVAKSGGVYFRYADDQMIFLQEQDAAERVMLLLSRSLDRAGLRVNQKKVFVWAIEDLERHRCRSIQSIFSAKGDNQHPEKVRLFVDAFLSMDSVALRETWNGGMPLLNRLLWAKLESLPQRLFDRVVALYLSDDYLLRATADKLERLAVLNRYRKAPANFEGKLMKLGDSAVHNAFHYEVLAYAKRVKLPRVAKLFRKRIKSLRTQAEGFVIE
jgi:hypothetical protein